MNMRRFLYLTIPILFALILLSAWYFNPQSLENTTEDIPAVAVETSKAEEVNIPAHTDIIGTLKSINQIEISSELAGKIRHVHFQSGDKVKKGAVLIELDDAVLKSEWNAAKENLFFSKKKYERIKALAAKRLSSDQSLDEALADFKNKLHQLNIKKSQLQKMVIRAPFSGNLGLKRISVGQYINVGEPLVKLVDNHTLRIEYHLPERYLPSLSLSQTASILSDAYPEKTFEAKVHYIDPEINEENRSITVEALLDNTQGLLLPGLFVNVKHQFNQEQTRILVPEESLIPTINGQKIFVIKNNKAVALYVETGSHHAEMTEVIKGLQADDIIIIRGQHKLKDGSSVIVVNKE